MTDKKPLMTAISTLAAASFSLSAMASQDAGIDLFEADELAAGFMNDNTSFIEGSCGEGSCGEGSCGEEGSCDEEDKDKDDDDDEKGEEGACGEGSCGEGSCGEGS